MKLRHTRVVAIVGGVAAIAAAAITLDVNSFSGWALTAGSASALSVVLFQLLKEPKQSLSQSIQNSLR